MSRDIHDTEKAKGPGTKPGPSNALHDRTERHVGKMDPGDQEALKGGIANKLFELAQNGRLNPKQFLTPRAQAKLEIALGPDKAQAFVGNLQQEAAMKAFETRAVPAAGSQTAALNQAMKDQDTFGQSQFAQDATAALKNSGGSPHRGVLNYLSDKVGQLSGKALDAFQTSGLSTAGRNEAGRLLMLSPGELAAALRSGNTGPAGPLALTSRILRAGNPALSGTLPLLLIPRSSSAAVRQ